MLCVLWATSNGCGGSSNSPDASKAGIVGTYKGSYEGGTEVFQIHDDGTFLQTFYRGTNASYTSSGKWLYESNMVMNGTYTNVFTNGVFREEKISGDKRSIKISRISFTPFIVPSGLYGCITNTMFHVVGGQWQRDPTRIELGAWPYFVRKVQDNEQAGK